MKVQVDNVDSLEGKPLLFSPQLNKEDWQGIIATSCVTGKDSLVLTLESHNLHPIALAAGEVIGEMEEVEITSPGKWHASDGKVCNIQPTGEPYETSTGFCSPEQAKKLFSMLDVDSSLEKEQKEALQRIIEEFNDVFALSQGAPR